MRTYRVWSYSRPVVFQRPHTRTWQPRACLIFQYFQLVARQLVSHHHPGITIILQLLGCARVSWLQTHLGTQCQKRNRAGGFAFRGLLLLLVGVVLGFRCSFWFGDFQKLLEQLANNLCTCLIHVFASARRVGIRLPACPTCWHRASTHDADVNEACCPWCPT